MTSEPTPLGQDGGRGMSTGDAYRAIREGEVEGHNPDPPVSRSMASGYSVRWERGAWQWSAYGPLGGNVGRASTHADAERAAREAEQRLSRPVGAVDPEGTGRASLRGRSET